MKSSIGITSPCKPYVSNQQTLLLPKSSHYSSSTTSRCHGSKRLRLITNSSNPLASESLNQSRAATRPAKLGDKWRKYQGCDNWEGLLDPLDDDLRSEILRYGEFVEATYRAFEFDTSSPDYATCRHPKDSVMSQCGLDQSGYRLTRNLRASCGVKLPRWVERAPSWMSKRSSWIGYVAVCDDKEKIARLGRRDVVIAYRGTATCLEWIENLRAMLTCLDGQTGAQSTTPMVEEGFLSLYTSRTATCPSLQETIREEIARILRSYGDEPLSVTIVGHSLGAALATLTAHDITSTFNNSPLVTVISFGGPRVGNKSFRSQLDKSGTNILRIVNPDDLITKMPGFVIDNNEVAHDKAVQVTGLPSWLQKRVEDTGLAYADVGKELRLSCKESPHLRKADLAKCHDLKTYLHLVNGFVSSTCPLRATAARVMKKKYAADTSSQMMVLGGSG